MTQHARQLERELIALTAEALEGERFLHDTHDEAFFACAEVDRLRSELAEIKKGPWKWLKYRNERDSALEQLAKFKRLLEMAVEALKELADGVPRGMHMSEKQAARFCALRALSKITEELEAQQ